MFISDFAIKRPLVTVVAMLALTVFGIFALLKLQTDEFPDIAQPIVVTQIIYPGASPEQVEREILDPVEEAIQGISGVDEITGEARDGYAQIITQYVFEKPTGEQTQDIRDAISLIRQDLPREMEEPILRRIDPSEFPIVQLALFSNTLTPAQLSRLADPGITRELRSIAGVGQVNVQGNVERQLVVELDPTRLQAAGVSVAEVVQAVQQQNLAAPVGRIEGALDERTIRLQGRFEEPEDFQRLVVASRDGRLIRLGDVGRAIDGTDEARTLALYNGREAVGIDVLKTKGYSTTAIADQVLARVDEVKKTLPPGASIDVVRNSGFNVRQSVGQVEEALVEGALLTVLVVFLFLNSWRSTVITGLALPVSVLASFVAVWWAGFTLNSMSLLGLSLAIGILIDDAIVVRENIVRHVEMGKDHYTAAREGTDEIGLAVAATTFSIVAVFVPVAFMYGIAGQWFKPFGLTIACSVLVSLFVSFSLDPMLSAYWPDPHREEHEKWWITKQLDRFNHWFDRQAHNYRGVIAWALDHRGAMVILALGTFLGSFVLASRGMLALGGALVGIILAVWLLGRRPNAVLHGVGALVLAGATAGALFALARNFDAGLTVGSAVVALVLVGIALGLTWLTFRAATSLLRRSYLSWSSATGSIALGLLVAAALIWKAPVWRNVGSAFLGEDDNSELSFALETPPGSNLDYTRLKIDEVTRIIRRHPEVTYTFATVGGQSGSVDEGNVYVKLKPKADRNKHATVLARELRAETSRLGGVTTSVFVNSFGGNLKQIQLQLRGKDGDALQRAADMLAAEVRQVPGAVDVGLSTKGQKPELELDMNRGLAGTLGLSVGQVAASLYPAFAGIDAGDWVDPSGETRDVEVRLTPASRERVSDLAQLPLTVVGENGLSTIPLGQVATIRRTLGPAVINHLDRDRVISVQANTSGRALGEVMKDINARVEALQFPPGVRMTVGGESKDQGEVFGNIFLALGIAVMLMYLILVVQFGSFLDPLAILISLPLSLIGVMIALAVTGKSINIMSMIGVILLAGIVAKNAILLIDFAKWARERDGLPLREALIEAGAIRLRPILMTTFALIAGMLPIALGRGEGAEWRAPLGISVIGGVITSTFLTLLVIPTFYEIFDGTRTRVARMLGRQPSQRTAEHRVPQGGTVPVTGD